jgi:hypothetical protein
MLEKAKRKIRDTNEIDLCFVRARNDGTLRLDWLIDMFRTVQKLYVFVMLASAELISL